MAREHTTSWEAAAYREGAVACRSAGAATVRMGTNTRQRKRTGRLYCGAQSVRTDQQHAECVTKRLWKRGEGGAALAGVGLGVGIAAPTT